MSISRGTDKEDVVCALCVCVCVCVYICLYVYTHTHNGILAIKRMKLGHL